MNKQKGFTLIELMIVVAIVGILAAIVYPSYLDSTRKSRRNVAQGDLMELSGMMERLFTETGCYNPGTDLDCNTGTAAAPVLPFNESPKQGGTKFYDLTVTTPTATSYILTATAKGDQLNDACLNLTLTQTGARTPAANCW
jgi:type IV pilus assembly protein PilE